MDLRINPIVKFLRIGAIACAAALWLAAVSSAQTIAPVWKSYSYPTDGFQASYPGEPSLQKKDVDTQAGKFELRTYTTQVGGVALFIGVCDYGDAASARNPDSLLEGAKNGALMNSSSHIKSEKKIMLGTNHGLEYEAESDSAHFTARIYMVGTTLYQTLVMFPLGKPYDDASRFLDSFQLIPRVDDKGSNS